MDVKYLNQKFLSKEVFLANIPTKLIITFGIIIRAIAYLSLPSQPSALAPDEGTYAKLVDWIFLGKPVQEFPDYGDGLFNSARILILPSVGLSHLGFSSLSSVRIISLVFSVLNILIFYYLMRTIQPLEKQKVLAKVILTLYLFMPSHMIWGVLGLRESLTEFGLLLIFYFLRKIFLDQTVMFSNYFLLFVGLYVTYNVRPQLGLVISIVVFLSILFKFWKNKIVILALLFFPIANFFANSVPLGLPQTISTVSEKYSSSPEEVSAYFEDKRTGNQLFAKTKIDSPKCDSELARFSSIKCEIVRLPVAVLQVTLRPLIFLDSGSITQNLASLENLIWIFLYILILLTSKSLLSSKSFNFDLPAILLISLLALCAGLYEGNIGTAFRQKGILLPFLLLILLSRIPTLNLSRVAKLSLPLKNSSVSRD